MKHSNQYYRLLLSFKPDDDDDTETPSDEEGSATEPEYSDPDSEA